MKPQQERVSALLHDTIVLMCRNGFTFTNEVKVQGLLGITLDNGQIILVHVNESVGKNCSELNVDEDEDDAGPSQPEHNPARRSSAVTKHNTSAPGRSGIKTRPVKAVHSSGVKKANKSVLEHNSEMTLKLEGFDENQFEDDPDRSYEDDSQENDIQLSDSDPMLDEYISKEIAGFERMIQPDMNSSGECSQKQNRHTRPYTRRGPRPRLSGQKLFMCEYEGCGLEFIRSSTLHRHQRLKHGKRFGTTDQDVYLCTRSQCGRAFYRRNYLLKHERDVHGYDHDIQDEPNEAEEFELHGGEHEMLDAEQILNQPGVKLELLVETVQKTVVHPRNLINDSDTLSYS